MRRFYIPDHYFLPVNRTDETQEERIISERQRKKPVEIRGKDHREIRVEPSSVIFAG
ncbi:hypothetical protein [Niabella sp.]|uniref:hypothetical protein n=1 Tax=Niabella sp. TaxID=1962976 RepID=UPI0026107E2A|nr:hypothetical protein [Niabella sp.]